MKNCELMQILAAFDPDCEIEFLAEVSHWDRNEAGSIEITSIAFQKGREDGIVTTKSGVIQIGFPEAV